MSFEGSQVSSGVLAEAELLPVRFLAILHVSRQVAPLVIISRLQLLGREDLLLGGHSGDQADGAAHDHPRNSTTPTGRTPLMRTSDAKAVFQVVIGRR